MKSKLPVPTAKDINEAHRLARTSAETAIGHAIRCGQLLERRKCELDRGEFDGWVEKHCDFGRAMAYRYIKVASQSSTAVDDSSRAAAAAASFPSIRSLLGYSDSKPQKSQPDTSAQSVKGAVMNPPGSAAQGSEAGNRNKPVGVDTGSVRPPVPVPDPVKSPAEVTPAPELTDYEPDDDEEYQARIENVMMADDKLSAMRWELKKQQTEIHGLKASRDHYQTQAGEAVRLVKIRDREIDRLKRDLEKARTENESLRERVAIMEQAA